MNAVKTVNNEDIFDENMYLLCCIPNQMGKDRDCSIWLTLLEIEKNFVP